MSLKVMTQRFSFENATRCFDQDEEMCYFDKSYLSNNRQIACMALQVQVTQGLWRPRQQC